MTDLTAVNFDNMRSLGLSVLANGADRLALLSRSTSKLRQRSQQLLVGCTLARHQQRTAIGQAPHSGPSS
jgi:hypothetical protein